VHGVSVRVTPLAIEGLLLVEFDLHRDERGFFAERYNRAALHAAGFPAIEFVQDNHARSLPGVLRGVHFQDRPEQGKLVGVARGRAFDVAVDLRPGSGSFGRHLAIELDGERGSALWIPPGFGHGYCVMGDEPCDLIYKVDAPWSAAGEGGVHHADPDLAIPWPLAAPIVSARDRALPSLAELVRRRG
jgi:dTDP-4-dehydrorhamnose 3,5-epimerase